MMLPLQPDLKVSKAYWFVDRKHHFSSSPGSAAEWIGVKRMVVVVVGWDTQQKRKGGGEGQRRGCRGVGGGGKETEREKQNWKNKRGTGALLLFQLRWHHRAVSPRTEQREEGRGGGEERKIEKLRRRERSGCCSKKQLSWSSKPLGHSAAERFNPWETCDVCATRAQRRSWRETSFTYSTRPRPRTFGSPQTCRNANTSPECNYWFCKPMIWCVAAPFLTFSFQRCVVTVLWCSG